MRAHTPISTQASNFVQSKTSSLRVPEDKGQSLKCHQPFAPPATRGHMEATCRTCPSMLFKTHMTPRVLASKEKRVLGSFSRCREVLSAPLPAFSQEHHLRWFLERPPSPGHTHNQFHLGLFLDTRRASRSRPFSLESWKSNALDRMDSRVLSPSLLE